MKRVESKFGTLFRHWVFANAKDLATSSFELKDTHGKNYLPFVALEEHQVNYSLAINKSPKGTLTRVEAGTIGAPDYIYLKNCPAYIVIHYPHFFCLIDINVFIYEKEMSKKSSLTTERAREIAKTIVDL